MSNSTTNLDLLAASQANKEVSANALFDAASPAMLYGRRAVTSTGLTFGYYGGTVSTSATPTQIANGTITLAGSATNYVEADPATGAVSVNQTAFTGGKTPLYSVVTGASTVTSYTDLRVLGGGSSTGTVKSVNSKTPDGSGAVTLTASDVGADASGAASAAVAAHDAASDPHPQYLTQTEGDARYAAAGAGGTVTSVDLSVPGLLYSVSGTPVTGSGTLTFSLKTQAANLFLAGPASGAAAAPTMRTITQADLPAQPFDVTAFYPGVPSASALITRIPVARAVTFPSSLSGSIGKASVAATSQTDFDVQKNGSSVGTIRFAAGATSATFIAASTVSLAAADILSIVAPGTPDATLANIGFVLAGTR